MRLFSALSIMTAYIGLMTPASAMITLQDTQTSEQASQILEKLKDAPVLSEQSHNKLAPAISADTLPIPTQSSIVIPVAALQVPAIAESLTPVSVDPESGVALGGYDPVGYFTENAAIKGTSEFTAQYQGATYYFSSEANRDLFLASEDKYAPAYGGYCTETLAHGALTSASPLHWTIHGDRLFLTRSAQSTKSFREERATRVPSADEFWKQVDTALNFPNAGANERL